METCAAIFLLDILTMQTTHAIKLFYIKSYYNGKIKQFTQIVVKNIGNRLTISSLVTHFPTFPGHKFHNWS